MSPKSGEMIAFQPRASTSINKVFTFCECHPKCACNKDLCQNFLVAATNKKRFKFCIKRVKKYNNPIYQNPEAVVKSKIEKTEFMKPLDE